jgi:opacity protein-like surface antigen
MRRLLIAALSTVCLIAAASDATARDASGNYQVFGFGYKSCGAYLADEDGGTPYNTWLGGYLTAFDHETSGLNNILDGTDMSGAIAWVKNYCQQYPTDQFSTAARKFTKFMMEKSHEHP